jgi:hypothetical protein
MEGNADGKTLTGKHVANGLSRRESRTRWRNCASAQGWISLGLRS